jgi:hypothetical protein
VQQVDEHAQALLHHFMRAASLDVDDEPDATRVVFEAWVIQANGERRSGNRHRGWLFMPYLDAEGKYNDGIGPMSKSDTAASLRRAAAIGLPRWARITAAARVART